MASFYELWNYNGIPRRSFALANGGTAVVESAGLVSEKWFNAHAGAFCDELHEYSFESFLAGQESRKPVLDDKKASDAIQQHILAARSPGRSTWISLGFSFNFRVPAVGINRWKLDGESISLPGPANGPSHVSDNLEEVAWTAPASSAETGSYFQKDILVAPGTHTLSGELRFWREGIITANISQSFSITEGENLVLRCTIVPEANVRNLVARLG